MESSRPFSNLSLSMQHSTENASEGSFHENGFQQMPPLSSQSLLNFLPSLHDAVKGSSDLHGFNVSTSENVHEESLQPSFKMNDSCNLMLDPFASEQPLDGRQTEHGIFQSSHQTTLRNFSNESSNILSQGSNCPENSLQAHQSQEQENALSSQSFRESGGISGNNLQNFDTALQPPLAPYCCNHCKKQFMHYDDLSEHVNSNHTFQTAEASTVSGNNNNQCCQEVQFESSESSTNNQPSIVETILNENPDKTILCNICNDKFSSENELIEHKEHEHRAVEERKKEEEYIFNCAFCPKAFKTQELLAKHESRHPYKTSAIQCSKCMEILGNYMLLQEHKQYEDYLSSCDICGELFPNEECMICHIRNAHNDFEDVVEDECGPSQMSEELSKDSVTETTSNQGCLQEPLDLNLQSNTTDLESTVDQRLGEKEELSVSQDPPLKLSSSSLQDENAVIHEQPETVHEKSISNESEQPEEAVGGPDVSNDIPFVEESSAPEPDVLCAEGPQGSGEEQSSNDDCGSTSGSSKPQKVKCHYCSKKCSTQKSLIRHERCHPYGTAAMKCNLCLEVVENYKALKIHKKKLGSRVSCSTCDQLCPNELCLLCHVRNVHNNRVYKVRPVYNLSDDSNDAYNFGEEEEGSDSDGAQQFCASRYGTSDSGAPLRITIKQEKEDIEDQPASPTFSAPTPPTPSTPSTQGPPTPSPPPFVFESEPSEADDGDEYEPYASDVSISTKAKGTTRRKSSLRITRKSSTNSVQFLSSEESDGDESGDNYSPEESVSEEESDDADWGQGETSLGSKRKTRRKNPISDESDDDPDWQRAKGIVGGTKKRGRRKKGPLSDDSDNDLDWRTTQISSVVPKKKIKKTRRKRGTLSDSDNDPDWRKAESNPGIIKKKGTGTGRRGRPKKLQVAFFVPAIPVPKRPRARGLGGQKAQDAATALAQAVEDMETSVPELKTVIRPVRKSATKGSLKRYCEIFDDDYDYLVDVKPEPKDDQEDSEQIQYSPQGSSVASFHQGTNNIHNENSYPSSDGLNMDQQEEEIVIKAEPYDFQDDEFSQSADLYFSRKFCENNSKLENRDSSANRDGADSDADTKVIKRERYGCKICGRPMQYRSHLIRHLRKVHDGEGVEEVMRRMMQCRFCSKPYTNELSLINHEKLHDGTSKMKCNKCDERFDDKNALRRHQRKTHWEHQPVECEICKKQLSDNTCLKAHMKHMHGSEEKKVVIFTCEACGKQLHTKTAFQNHVASKCGTNLLFPCETCGKSFSFKGSLKAHQLLHSGVKSFLCKFCGKAFHQKGEMKRHERKHTGEKPFICEVCGRAFAYRESLLGHSAVHTGIKPFPCKACGMRFSCSGNLVKHRRSNNCKGELGNNSVAVSGAENTQEDPIGDQPGLIVEQTKVSADSNTKPCPVESVPNESNILVSEITNLSNKAHCLSDEAHKSSNEGYDQKQENCNKQGLVQSMVGLTQTQSQPFNQGIIVSSASMSSVSLSVSSVPISSVALSASSTPMPVSASSVITTAVPASHMTSVIKSAPSIHVKSASALQSTSKETKQNTNLQMAQSQAMSSNVSNRVSDHVNNMYGSHENGMTAQSNYNSHNVATSYGDNHYRQSNQANLNDRRFMQFSMDGYAGRTDQYFDRQALMRQEMTRQAMERTVDRQTSRFLDWTGGVQFSGMDSRSTMQAYPTASIPTGSGYPNIHSGPLGNYTSTHAASHSNNHTNVYGGNTIMPGGVNFSAFTANNHLGMTYAPNNTIPAHSVAHSSSYPASHMSHLEALFGHFGHPSGTASSNFPRLSSHNVGSSANPSLPTNHRV